MVTIVTRAGKGSPLTHNEVDANFTNLNSGKAETASPALTGTPTSTTAAVGTNTTQIATTAFVNAEIANDITGKANLASPAFTGTVSLNGTAITATATELNVLAGIPAGLTATELGYVDGVTSAIQTQLNAKAATASPTFTGTVGLPAATVSDGVTTTADNDGTFSSGTYTPTPVGGNMKVITNSGAFTFAAPSAAGDYTLIVRILNSATAGAITLSGFNKTGGDVFTTTNTHNFFVHITKISGLISGTVQALQ